MYMCMYKKWKLHVQDSLEVSKSDEKRGRGSREALAALPVGRHAVGGVRSPPAQLARALQVPTSAHRSDTATPTAQPARPSQHVMLSATSASFRILFAFQKH